MVQSECVFCRIVNGQEYGWTIWEDECHIAFLTPFPNTKGFTVVSTKAHLCSDVFLLSESEYLGLMKAAKVVADLLNRGLGTKRAALIAEGMGINHAHVKLIPLFGISNNWEPNNSIKREVYSTYPGFISSHDGPRASNEDLDKTVMQIKNAIIK